MTAAALGSNSRSVRAVPWTIANAAFQLLSKLGVLVVLSRLLDATEFGLFYMGLAVVLVLGTVAQMGVPTNVIYVEKLDRPTMAAALWLGLGSSCFWAAAAWVVYIISYGAHGSAFDLILLVALFYLPFHVIAMILEALARREFRFRLLALAELAGTLVGSLAVSAALALIGWGVWALATGQAVYLAIRLSFLLSAAWPMLSLRPSCGAFGRISHASLAITVSEVANIAAVYAMRPLVGVQMGVAAAGIWSRYYQIIALQLGVLVEPIDRLVLPALSRQRGDGARIARHFLALVEIVSLLTLPAALVTVIIAPLAVPMAFGPGWDALILPMQIGSVMLFLRSVDRVLLSATRSVGRMGARAVGQVVQLGMILAGFLAAMPYGLPAVTAAYVFTQSASLLMLLGVWQWSSGIRIVSVLRAVLPGALATAPGVLLAAIVLNESYGVPAQAAAAVLGLAFGGLLLLSLRRRLLSPAVNDLLKNLVQAAFRQPTISTPRQEGST